MAISAHSAIWKVVFSIVAVCLVVQFFRSTWTTDVDRGQDRWEDREQLGEGDREQLQKDRIASSLAANRVPDSFGWTYNWVRDRESHDLAEWQCNAAFPDLYQEIDRAVSHWQGRNITRESMEVWDANEGSLRLLIHDQQLRIIRTKGMKRDDFRSRTKAVLNQLHRAISAVRETDEAFPDMEFTVVLDDIPSLADSNHTVWSFTRRLEKPLHDNLWLMPDYHYWAAPPESRNFTDMQNSAREHDAQLVDKIPKAAWRGVKWTAPGLRSALLSVTKDQPWADVKVVSWQDGTNVMNSDELCDYMFLINTEGRSWSSRLTYLLNCDSVPIVHDPQWTAHFYHLLQPYFNFIPVSRDFSDLQDKVEHYLNDTDAAQVIADNARTTFRERYITPAATACYWRRLLRSWSSIAFEPQVYVPTSESYEDVRLRGISFDTFISSDMMENFHDG